MAPLSNSYGLRRRAVNTFGNWRDIDNAEGYVVESWGEGLLNILDTPYLPLT